MPPSIAETISLYEAYQKLVAAVIIQALKDYYQPKAATPLMHQHGAVSFLNDPAAAAFCEGWDIDIKRLEGLYRGMVKR